MNVHDSENIKAILEDMSYIELSINNNYVRFENVFEFGASYQLTVNNMDKLNVGLAAGVKGMIVNLFNIPTFTMDFPFLVNNSNVISHYGYYYYVCLCRCNGFSCTADEDCFQCTGNHFKLYFQ